MATPRPNAGDREFIVEALGNGQGVPGTGEERDLPSHGNLVRNDGFLAIRVNDGAGAIDE